MSDIVPIGRVFAWSCSVGLQAPRVYPSHDEALRAAGDRGSVSRLELVRAELHDPWTPGPHRAVPVAELWSTRAEPPAVLLAYSRDGWAYLVDDGPF